MKKKIITLFCVLFSLFAFGALVAALNLDNTTNIFNHLVKLHQIERLRHELVEKVLKVQADLYTVYTPQGRELDEIVSNVGSLAESARGCTSCHHRGEIAAKLERTQVLIQELQESLSYYITASANQQRRDRLKTDAAMIGNDLLHHVESMTFNAARNIDRTTNDALGDVGKTKTVLKLLSVVAFFSGVLIAWHLTRSITRPIHELVLATRKIASGELGYTISDAYPAEFGELARNFNAMTISLREGYTTLYQEITERKQTVEALRISEERYALAALGANDGLWDWDLETGTVYFSSRWQTMLGYGENEIGNSPQEWFRLVHPDDRVLLEGKIEAHINGDTSHFEHEHRMRHKDGTYHWMRNRGIALRDPEGTAFRMAGSQTDISEQKSVEERLVHDAFHDTLTGLPNRALLMNRLQHVIDAAGRRQDFRYAVLFIDLDRFKVVNDSLGHVVGDQLLIAVGRRLAGFVRTCDTVARLGGDEFAILLEDIGGGDDAYMVARRIQQELPEPLVICGHEISTSASVGIALHSGPGDQPEHLLRDADLAMYQAKANGKSRYEVFDSVMHEQLLRFMTLENDLMHAIERNELRLDFQPIFSICANRISGFEALIRWCHPVHGLIPPSEFIPVAEETGLIISIGQWVLEEACRRISLLQGRFSPSPPLSVNVNLSCKEFTPHLIERVRRLLGENGIDGSMVRLEITESTIMGNPQATAELLLELKALGVGLQIDDFGTGYSSLSYLHTFPINALKIDQSFVRRMNDDRENLEIVKTIISLAHNLGMDVIGEGVETAEELAILRELGCEFVQGYFIARPMEFDAVEALLATGMAA